MSGPKPSPTSFQVRFSNANTTTDRYRWGALPALPHAGAAAVRAVEEVVGAGFDVVVLAGFDDELHAAATIRSRTRGSTRVLTGPPPHRRSAGTRPRQRRASSSSESPTCFASQARMGAAASRNSTIRSFARLVPSQAPAGHSRHVIRPFWRRRSMRG